MLINILWLIMLPFRDPLKRFFCDICHTDPDIGLICQILDLRNKRVNKVDLKGSFGKTSLINVDMISYVT